MDTRICYVAGISGGHIIPCLTLANQIKRNNPKTRILFFTSSNASDAQIIQHHQIVDTHVPLPFAHKPTRFFEYPLAFLYCIISCIKIAFHLISFRPQQVTTTGGIVAIPVCLLARLLRIPVYVYELNAIPGRATTFLAPYASKIVVCFETTKQYFSKNTTELADYPIRHGLINAHQDTSSARMLLGLDQDKKTILILGGSQGSRFINSVFKEWIQNNTDLCKTIQVIHQTGLHDDTDWHAFYATHHIQAYVFSFRHDIAPCYQAADLIICRAGAGTIFEVKSFKKKCLLIPLSTKTTSHQVDNAYAIEKSFPDLFSVIEQNELEKKPQLLGSLIEKLLK